MKRIISLVVILSLCLTLVVPAQASSVSEEKFIDLLSLSSSETNSYVVNSDYFEWDFKSPEIIYYKYVDVLFYADANLNGVYTYYDTSPLNLISLGGGYFRAYGTFNAAANYFKLIFDFDTSATFLQLISCRASNISKQTYPLGGSWNGYTSFEGDIFESGTFDGSTDLTVDIPYGGSAQYYNYNYEYSLKFYPGIDNKWQAYDEIDLLIGINGLALNSIVAYIDNVDVLKNVSFLDNGTFTDLRIRANDGTEPDSYYFEASNDFRWLIITLDLTKVQKSTSYYPQIRLDGLYEAANKPLFTISRCTGVIFDQSMDTDSFWFRRIYNSNSAILAKVEEIRLTLHSLFEGWFTSLSYWIIDLRDNLGGKLDQLINGSDQQQSDADQFNQDMQDQSNELDSLTGDLNAVERPPVEDVNVSVDDMVDPDVVILATSGVGTLVGNELILRVFIMAITFALAGFILYGKR